MKLFTPLVAGILLFSICIAVTFLEVRTVDDNTSITAASLSTVKSCEVAPKLSVIEEQIIETIPPLDETIPSDTLPPVEEPPVEEPVVYIEVTEEERELIARLVYQEAGICSLEVKKDIASVIINRFESGCWKRDMNWDDVITIYDIIYYPAAFSPAHLLPTTVATEDCYEAVDYVLTNGPTLPNYVRYFRMDYDFRWEGYVNYCVKEDVHFGYFLNWEKGAW